MDYSETGNHFIPISDLPKSTAPSGKTKQFDSTGLNNLGVRMPKNLGKIEAINKSFLKMCITIGCVCQLLYMCCINIT